MHEASSVQRQFLDGAALDDTFDGVAFIVDLRGGAFDDDQVLGAAQLHLEVHGSGASDFDGRFAHQSFEAGNFGAHFVDAGRQCRSAEESLSVGRNGSGRAGVFVRDDDGCVWNYGAGFVRDGSGDNSSRGLREGREAHEKSQQHQPAGGCS